MCGICGIYNLNQRNVLKETIEGMTRSLTHRGPDDEGIYLEGAVGLGFRRLSIIDIEGGAQPIQNENGTVWGMINGEIYNYKDLKNELIEKGHIFKSSSDSEVVVHLYEEYGENFIGKLQGMYGIALWDSKSRSLILGRDRLGIKPLYYYESEEKIIFASEIKSILKGLNKKPEVNIKDLPEYMNFGFLAGSATMFKDIKELLPGTLKIFSLSGSKEHEYWVLPLFRDSLPLDDYSYNFDEWVVRTKASLDIAITQRFIADVPFGIMLSGGVDSSLITLLGQRLREDKLDAFSVSMQPPAPDELKYALAVAEISGVNHQYIKSNEDFAINNLRKMTFHNDEPLTFDSGVWIYGMCKLARKNGKKILLSGEGADEIYGGYIRYVETFNRINNYAKNKARNNLTHRVLAATSHEDLSQKLTRDELLMMGNSVYSAKKVARLLGTIEWENSFRHEAVEKISRIPDPVKAMQALDQVTRLIPVQLRMDRMGMAASIEVRVPFLDHRLVEEASTIPSEYLMKRKNNSVESKSILKSLAIKEGLPYDVVHRKKIGMATQMQKWLKNRDGLGKYLQRLIEKDGRGYFDKSVINDFWNEHIKGKQDNRVVLWEMVAFEMWYEDFIEQ